jgi:hypothetical protein
MGSCIKKTRTMQFTHLVRSQLILNELLISNGRVPENTTIKFLISCRVIH